MVRSVSLLLVATRGLLLVIVAGAWITGIWLDSLLQMPQQPCLLFSGLSFLLLLIFWRDQRYFLILLLFLFVGLGAWRYSQTLPQYDPQSIEPLVGNSSSFSVQGTVVDEPKLQARIRTLTVSVNSIQNPTDSQWRTVDGTIEVVTLFQGSSLDDPYGANYGDSVEITGKLEPPTSTSAKNIIASMAFPRIAVSNAGEDSVIAAIYRLRNQLAIVIEQALPQPEAAILIAIFLGLHTPALNLLASDFNVTGTAHLIASSGFKVTILAGLVSRPTRKLLSEQTGQFPLTPLHKSWRDWVTMILILLSIALYTVLSGAGPAAQRAGIMGALIVIAPRSGRQYNVYTGLAGAALVMTYLDPFLLWDVGFQLSFLGTLGIVLLTPYFQCSLEWLAEMLNNLVRNCYFALFRRKGSTFLITALSSLAFPIIAPFMIELAAVTLAAEIATLPIVAITFQNISLIAPITNILTVPLLGLLIILGLMVSVTGLICHPLSLLCGRVTWPFLWFVQKAVAQGATIPGAYISILPGPLNDLIGWFYYALLVPASGLLLYRYPLSPTKKHASRLTPYNRMLLQAGSIVLIFVITGVIIISTPPQTNNTISFFNINVTKAHNKFIRGESIFIHTQDNKTLLIDGGGDSTALSQLLDQQLSPWQRSLDMIILTSPEQDAMTGLQDVVTRYDVGTVFDAGMAHPTTNYALWRRTISERNLQYEAVKVGAPNIPISLGTTTQIQVLWPQTLHSGSDEVRDNGLILRLVIPGLRLLLLGSSIQSNYALTGLLASVDKDMLKSDIVQVLGDMNTSVPTIFSNVLQSAQPSVVVVTSATPGKSHKAISDTHSTLSSALASIPQTLQTSQQGMGMFEFQGNSAGWTHKYVNMN